jgi:leucyl aminopeptidase
MTLKQDANHSAALDALALDRRAFDPAPSRSGDRPSVEIARTAPRDAAVGVPVGERGPIARSLGADRSALSALGFEGKVGQTVVVPSKGPGVHIAVGVGDGSLSPSDLRDAAAAFARAAAGHPLLATSLHDVGASGAAASAQAVAEGVLLARYRYGTLKHNRDTSLRSLVLMTSAAQAAAATAGAAQGRTTAAASALARDLANTPPSHLTATRLARLATEVAGDSGLAVEVLDAERLRALGCGGMLGVNAGSAEPPQLVKLSYRPKRKRAGGARLAFVGKGIMYDSGGISLKPTDAMHAAMKMDMSGAAAVLAAMSALAALSCPNEVTGYLMCTDNMPSGSAMKLGDVLHIHGGKTVEVHNTDAEGRLVLADGLALAVEDQPDAVVDIATLTGACLVALGTGYGGVLGNDQALVDRVLAAARAVDEKAWQLPLERGYRKLLDSDVADVKNVGGPYGGAITAAVFLSEFVGDTPWAHIDMASTMRSESDDGWRSKGATGYGARLLIELAIGYTKATGG